MPFKKFQALACAASMLACCAGALSAGSNTIENSVDPFDAPQDAEAVGLRNGSVVVVPIPFSNPTTGAGLTLAAGYLFKLDEGSKPSMVALAALGSDNGSQAFGAAANFAFDNNRWLAETLFAKASMNYDLFTDLGPFPIEQEGNFARMEFSYGFTPEFSVGMSLRYLDTTLSPDGLDIGVIPPPFDEFVKSEIISPGLVLNWDRRDDTIYPTQGSFLKAELSHNYTLKGLSDDYSKAVINYTHYFNPVPQGTIAARVSTCAVSTGSPFFDQCSLGASDMFRGFPVMQFIDYRSASVQLEYRHQFTPRLGGVAFVGAGQTGERFSSLSDGGTHSAFGVGARYRVSKKYPLDLSVDWARNNASERQLYVYVGQRF